jgi:hypothetical protein
LVKNDILKTEIWDMQGKKLAELQNTSDGPVHIDLSSYPNPVLLIIITTADNEISTIKLIKKR